MDLLQQQYHSPNNTRHIVKINGWFFVPFIVWMIAGPFIWFYFRDGALSYLINSHNNNLLDTWMPLVTWMGTGWFALACAIVLLIAVKCLRNKYFILSILICNLLPAIVTQLLKNIYNEPRPLKYFNDAGWIHLVEGQPHLYHLSFPSGHTTSAFALFCFIALLLPVKYKVIGLLCFLSAMAVAYSRIYLMAHFFVDVYVGSMIGGWLSMLAWLFLNHHHKISSDISPVQP